MPRLKISRAPVEEYADGIARAHCTSCDEDIYFFHNQEENPAVIRRVQHGDDPDNSIELYWVSSTRRLREFLKWHKNIHL